ncbi:MAG: nucleoside triphosphate pyrophosphohydrolase [Ardenticatenaceae bacterium]|nr:nucleoside triphosphate pyrophosphohydrolase [Ardenticatenaceae bacterium]MCB9442714.1 nucleoside triphosphate pyrophosphohydrolase [Ardenticatenaceae bacterium]
MGITVVGLGPGDGRFLTREAWAILAAAETVHVRTARHPAVADLPETVQVVSFDEVYETAVDFDAVYDQIVTQMLALGREADIVYAVPGHPFVGESTVTRLVKAAEAENVPVRVVAGLSFVEPSLTAVQADALDGLQIFDAIELTNLHYPPLNPDQPALLGQVYSRMLASELKLGLTAVYPEQHTVALIHAAGTAVESVERVPLYAIDRSERIDHLTSLYIPPLPYAASLNALAETVAVLRSPNGCPWDIEQTPQSMRGGLLEEASEVLEALDAEDEDGLREELGDLLYHIVMQTQMAAEEEQFTLSDIIAGIEAKLKRRHPHVWGDWEVADTAEVLRNWEMLKQDEKEKQAASLLDNIPQALPALARSQKIQDKVRKVGFDWPEIGGIYDKLAEELAEVQAAQTPEERADELGDLLFVTVNLASWLGVDAESALRGANLKFSQRFRQVEQLVTARNLDWAQLDLVALEAIWQEVKEGGTAV